jgi:acyl transferase domain-containing protein
MQAPNGPSQTSLVSGVIAGAGLSTADVAFVAVHGTGTPLGDPIEVSALGAALAPQQGGRGTAAARAPPAMGSVKACYGHTEGAAGVVGAWTQLYITSHLCMQRPWLLA